MREGDPEFERLREAVAAFAAASAPELIAEARAEAFARVRSMLSEAIAHGLLERCGELLDPARVADDPPHRVPASPPPAARSRRRPTSDVSPNTSVPPSAAPAEQGSLCYVYGVTRDLPAAASGAGIVGVDGEHSTRTIAHEGLAAIASEVPAAEFGEQPLRENLNDVAWLEHAARAHERVLDEAMQVAPVVPMRLCTIYLGEAEVREMLEREAAALHGTLDRLASKTEWGVKMIAAPGALDDALEHGDENPAAEGSPGAAYIQARRREAQARENLDSLAETWAEAVHEGLAEVASEALRNPLQAPEIAGYEGEMLLNGVYLVEDSETDHFRDLVGSIAEEWSQRRVEIELTGPWPPYNFVKDSVEAAR